MRNGDWYTFTVNGSSLDAADIIAAFEQIKKDFADERQVPQGDIVRDLENIPECPIRTTGVSPTLFIYGQAGQEVLINPAKTTRYADPGLEKAAWDITLQGNGKVAVNNVLRDYLYYEYQNVSFSRPEVGWTVEKDQLSSFVSSLASSLKLTPQEQERLLFELKSASSAGGKTLFVGIINPEEIDELLPLSVQGIRHIVRLHFYVGTSGSQAISAPTLKPIERHSSFVLELGAIAER